MVLTISLLIAAFAALILFARVFLKRSRQQAVLKQFWQALEKEPTNGQIWANLGYIYVEIGKLDKARLCVERLRTIEY